MYPLLQINNLSVEFPGTGSQVPALQNFSMQVNKGEVLSIVGESGSGKSVMALTLLGLTNKAARITSGEILFSPDGIKRTDLLTLSEREFRILRGNRLSMIFQEPMTSLNPLMRCGWQLAEPLMLHKKLSRVNARKEVITLLQKVELPDPQNVYEKYPHQLSGGQKQRVMIAMAISCRPALLICDEPTTALDVRVQKTILELLKSLRHSESMGMIFVTHDLGLVADIADRTMVMLKGQVVEEGTVKEIFNHPTHAYTRGLLMCRPSLHVKGTRLPVVADFLNKNDVAAFAEKLPAAAPQYTDPGTIKPETLVEIRNLTIRYPIGRSWLGKKKNWVNAVEDISFKIYKGETLGLVGESGSGKTTIGRALLGLNSPAGGSIDFQGRELNGMSKKELRSFRKNIQIVFQDPYSSLNPRLQIGRAIAEPLKVHSSKTRTERNRLVADFLKTVELKPEHFTRYPDAFSGGQRQRIVIARALILEPGFVVFDESVSALDVSIQAQVLNLINDLKSRFGFTVVFISHDLSVIRYLCDRVVIMEKGKLVEYGDVESVYSNPQSRYTQSLIDAIPGRSLLEGVPPVN